MQIGYKQRLLYARVSLVIATWAAGRLRAEQAGRRLLAWDHGKAVTERSSRDPPQTPPTRTPATTPPAARSIARSSA